MTNSATDKDTLKEKAKTMAKDGRNITYISETLGIEWGEARRYTGSWRGTKVKLTNRFKKLVTEPDPSKRQEIADEADKYADFLYDAAKHLRGQVDAARKALNR